MPQLTLQAVLEFTAKNLAALEQARQKVKGLEGELKGLQEQGTKTTGSWDALSNQLGNVGLRGFSRITQAMAGANMSVGSLGPRIAAITQGLASASLVITAVTEGLKLATLPARLFASALAEIVNTALALAKRGALVTGVLAGLGGVLAGLGLKKIVEVNAQFESFGVQLETLYKSKAKAQWMLEWIREMGERTPFDVTGLVQAALYLEVYGLSATKWLPLVGDMAAGMQRSVEDAAMAIGKATIGESERLKEMGITSEALLKAGAKGGPMGGVMAQGRENREALTKALETVVVEKFAGAMTRAGGTWRQMVSEMGDVWSSFLLGLGRGGLFENVKRVLSVFNETMGKVRDTGIFKRMGEALGALSKGITQNLVEVIQRLPRALAWLEKKWPDIAKVIGEAWSKLKASMAWLWEQLPFWMADVIKAFAGLALVILPYIGEMRMFWTLLKLGALSAAVVVVDALTTIVDGFIVMVAAIRQSLLSLSQMGGPLGAKFKEWAGYAAEGESALRVGRGGLKGISTDLSGRAAAEETSLRATQAWINEKVLDIKRAEQQGLGAAQRFWQGQQNLGAWWKQMGPGPSPGMPAGALLPPIGISGAAPTRPGSWDAPVVNITNNVSGSVFPADLNQQMEDSMQAYFRGLGLAGVQ